MNVEQIVAAINGPDANQKAELTAKLSASADKRPAFKTLRAARAAAYNKARIDQMLALAKRLIVSHLITEDLVVSIDELNRELRGKDLEDRLVLKSQLSALSMM